MSSYDDYLFEAGNADQILYEAAQNRKLDREKKDLGKKIITSAKKDSSKSAEEKVKKPSFDLNEIEANLGKQLDGIMDGYAIPTSPVEVGNKKYGFVESRYSGKPKTDVGSNEPRKAVYRVLDGILEYDSLDGEPLRNSQVVDGEIEGNSNKAPDDLLKKDGVVESQNSGEPKTDVGSNEPEEVLNNDPDDVFKTAADLMKEYGLYDLLEKDDVVESQNSGESKTDVGSNEPEEELHSPQVVVGKIEENLDEAPADLLKNDGYVGQTSPVEAGNNKDSVVKSQNSEEPKTDVGSNEPEKDLYKGPLGGVIKMIDDLIGKYGSGDESLRNSQGNPQVDVGKIEKKSDKAPADLLKKDGFVGQTSPVEAGNKKDSVVEIKNSGEGSQGDSSPVTSEVNVMSDNGNKQGQNMEISNGSDDNHDILPHQSDDFNNGDLLSKFSDEEKDKLRRELDELLNLRFELENDGNNTEKLGELIKKTMSLESAVTRDPNTDDYFEHIASIDSQINAISDKIMEYNRTYEESYKKLSEIIAQKTMDNSNLSLTEEEYDQNIKDSLAKMTNQSIDLIQIKRDIDDLQTKLESLKRRKSRYSDDFSKAQELGISLSEYETMSSVLGKKGVYEKILKEKGNVAIDIPPKERSKEDKASLSNAKKEIQKEIADKMTNEPGLSVLDSIQILYGFDPKAINVTPPKTMQMGENGIDNVKNAANQAGVVKVPVPDGTTRDNNNKEPLPGPEDMLAARGNAGKGLQERITIYTNSNKKYAREYVLGRFGISKGTDEKVLINGLPSYELTENDVETITKAVNSESSSSEIVYSEVSIDNIKEPNKDIQEPKKDVQEPRKDVQGPKKDVQGPKKDVQEPRKDVQEPQEKMNNATVGGQQNSVNNGVQIFVYINGNNIYASQELFSALGMKEEGHKTNVDGKEYYEIGQLKETINRKGTNSSPIRRVQLNNFKKTSGYTANPINNNSFANGPGLIDKFTMYNDLDNNGVIYVRKNTLVRFNVRQVGNDVRINGATWAPISREDANWIKSRANNSISPYIVEEKGIRFNNQNSVFNQSVRPEPAETIFSNNRNPFSKTGEQESVKKIIINIYVGDNVGEIYAPEAILDLLHYLHDDSPITIDNINYYKIDGNILNILKGLAESHKNPKFIIEYHKIGKKEHHIYDSDTKPERITLYIDKDDNDQVYADEWTMNYLDLIRKLNDKSTTDIFGKKCYKIGKDIHDRIKLLAKSTNIKIEYKNVALGKTNKKSKDASSVKEIINKLVAGLDLKDKDAAKKANRDAYVSKGFLKDLNESNVLFNIISSVPASYKVIVRGFKKLTGNFATKRGREETEKLGSRINALTKDELEVLFNDFPTTLTESQTNHIDAMLVPKIRQYGVDKAQKLTSLIEKDYLSYLDNQTRVNKIGEELRRASIDAQERNRLETERSGLLTKSADCVKRILKNRDLINNIFEKGIDGLEDDVKNSSSRFNYLCIKFRNQKVYDKEIAPSILAFQKILKEGLKNNDSDRIVTGFSELEKVVYDNMYDRNNRNKDKSELGRRVVSYYDLQEDAAEYAVNPEAKGPVKSKHL